MAKNERFDESVSRWLEETAPARLPERVLSATFERTRRSRQHVGWRALLGRFHMNRFMTALGGAAAVLIVAALALSFYVNQPDVGGPATPAPTASQSPAPITSSLPAEQTAVIARHAATLNSRDAEAFVEVFAASGVFKSAGLLRGLVFAVFQQPADSR